MSNFKDSYEFETRLGHSGRDPMSWGGTVNPPVHHASTILSPDLETYISSSDYGRRGTLITRSVEEAAALIEGGDKAVSFPSGLAAISGALTPFLNAGDHLLIADNIYQPTRRFSTEVLSRFNIETEYFDPKLGANVRRLFRNNTKVIFFESPGSQTFEVMDIPSICAVSREYGILTIMDNTWSAGFYFKPFDHGVDVVVQAATKYFNGHADAMLGFVISKNKHDREIRNTAYRFGTCVGPDVCHIALRGVRTLPIRLTKHYENGLKIAEWLTSRKEVDKVLHPALPSCPGHKFWKRDFTGASGLFGVALKPAPDESLRLLIDGLKLFGLGDSWGGYESLLTPTNAKGARTVTKWPYKGPCIRIHAGLENINDLIDDLSAGLDRFRNAV